MFFKTQQELRGFAAQPIRLPLRLGGHLSSYLVGVSFSTFGKGGLFKFLLPLLCGRHWSWCLANCTETFVLGSSVSGLNTTRQTSDSGVWMLSFIRKSAEKKSEYFLWLSQTEVLAEAEEGVPKIEPIFVVVPRLAFDFCCCSDELKFMESGWHRWGSHAAKSCIGGTVSEMSRAPYGHRA